MPAQWCRRWRRWRACQRCVGAASGQMQPPPCYLLQLPLPPVLLVVQKLQQRQAWPDRLTTAAVALLRYCCLLLPLLGLLPLAPLAAAGAAAGASAWR